MEKKTRYSCKPSTQKLIVAASLSMALLCGLPAAPALAETTDTSTVSAPESTSKSYYPKWKIVDGKFYFYTEDGTILKSQWITYNDSQYYVDETGAAVSGFYTTPDGKTWYFQPGSGLPYARYGLMIFLENNNTPSYHYTFYYVDKDNGLIKNNWVKTDHGWSWAGADGRFIEGWFTAPNGTTWYLTVKTEGGAPVITDAASVNGKLYFFDPSTGLLRNSWVNMGQGVEAWCWAGPDGAAISGWFKTPDGKTWYADPKHYNEVVMGGIDINGKYYFFDHSNGLVTHGWIEDDGEWAWIETVGSVYSGWKHMPNGKWFYFDPKDPYHRMLVGVIQTSSGTYYIDESAGMTANNWVQLPEGGWAWAQSSGAFASGWYTTPNGKTWYFDPAKPSHPAYTGEHTIDGKDYYFDAGYGLARNQWITRSDGVRRWAGPDGVLTSYKR